MGHFLDRENLDIEYRCADVMLLLYRAFEDLYNTLSYRRTSMQKGHSERDDSMSRLAVTLFRLCMCTYLEMCKAMEVLCAELQEADAERGGLAVQR